MARVILVRVTGEPVAVGPSGNVHVSAVPVAVNVSVLPVQAGFGDADTFDGAAGVAVTLTLTEAVPVHPEGLVTVTVYVPVKLVVELGRVGFCNALEKLAGPLQL